MARLSEVTSRKPHARRRASRLLVAPAFIIVVCLLLGLQQVLFEWDHRLLPKYWFLGFACASGLLVTRRTVTRILQNPITLWGAGYIVASAIAYGIGGGSADAMNRATLVVTSMILVCGGWVFMSNRQAQSLPVGKWTAIVLCILTISVFVDAIHPEYFRDLGSRIVGRPSGFYLNPNGAAIALCALLMFAVPHLSRRNIAVVLPMAGVAVIMTWSRGEVLVWALLVACVIGQGLVSRVSVATIGVVAVIALLLREEIFRIVSSMVGQGDVDVIGRLGWMLGTSSTGDGAAIERIDLVRYSWEEFLRSPLVGGGLGATLSWDQGTHNMILQHLNEYGIVGVFVYPGFLLSLYLGRVAQANRSWLAACCLIALMLGVTSHNLLEEPVFVLCMVGCSQVPVRNQALSSARARRSVVHA